MKASPDSSSMFPHAPTGPIASDKKRRRRSDFPFFLSYRTRWSDNDQYAHVNNTVYYHLIDAVVNTYLIQHCGVAPTQQPQSHSDLGAHTNADGNGAQIGLVVSSFCEFFSPLSFPDVLDLGLRVARLGQSSVTYEVGVFKSRLEGDAVPVDAASQAADAPAAVGGYTHVFVDKRSRTSVAMHPRTRAGLEKLVTTASSKL